VLPPEPSCASIPRTENSFLHGEALFARSRPRSEQAERVQRTHPHALERNFPIDKIEEAIKRLTNAAMSSRPHALPSARWRLLGEPRPAPGSRRQISKDPCFDSSDRRQRRKRIGAALASLVRGSSSVRRPDGHAGERLSRTTAGRTEPRTRVRTRRLGCCPTLRRLSAGGPVFIPGETACWTCLFDRMYTHREVKGFLDRGPARRRRGSPLAATRLANRHPACRVEIAKAIATGFRTDLREHIVSFDRWVRPSRKHYVGPARNVRPAAARAAGPAPSAGADRAWRRRQADDDQRRLPDRYSRATVARFRKHVSPLTGVVTRLERIEAICR